MQMKKSEQTRQLIIEQAAQLFNEKGVAGTSIDDILEATQVAKGCLYGHFESKEQLACASADYLFNRLVERRMALVLQHNTSVDKLYAYIGVNAEPVTKPNVKGGCPVVNLGAESDDTNPAIRSKVGRVLSSGLQFLKEIMQEGIKAGELSKKLRPEEFAVKIMATIEGATLMSRAMNSDEPMKTAMKSLRRELAAYSKID